MKHTAAKFTVTAPFQFCRLILMRDFCVYVLYRAGSAIVSALPLETVFTLGRVAGFIAWALLPNYRRLALENARIALGQEKNVAELRRLVRAHFLHLGANIFCSAKLAVTPLAEIEAHIRIEHLDVVHEFLRAGRPVVLILSHLGSWELCAQILPKFIGYVRNSTIYQRLRNKHIDEHVRRLRARFGVEMFDRKDGFRKAIQLLRGGGAIGILSDQHAGDHGVWVPFFGKLASTTPLPALLAKRTNAALIGVAFYTDGRARWRILFEPPLDTKSESVEAVTARINDLIARQIRRLPEDWFWVHNRWKTPRPNFLLSRYKRGTYVPPRTTLQPFRILIRATNWLGDSIMSIPAVRAIKRGRPDAHLTVVAPERIMPIWNLVREIDEKIALTSRSLVRTVQAIREEQRFDAAILFPNSLRAAMEVWWSGIPRRVGYRGHWRRLLLNQVIRRRGKRRHLEHHALAYLRIAEDCGAEVAGAVLPAEAKGLRAKHSDPAASDPVGRTPTGSSTRFSAGAAHAVQELERPFASTDPPLLALCPGAEYGPAKRWLPECFAEVAMAVTERTKAKWVLFGTENDESVGNIIANVLGKNCVNRIGQTNLEQLIDELSRCRLLLTNDTGTMHLASFLAIPTIAVFGSTEPRLTGPLGHGHAILRHQVECSPCFLRECPIDFRCMKAVRSDEVISAVLSVLDSTGRLGATSTPNVRQSSSTHQGYL